MQGKIKAISISQQKGTKKFNVDCATLKEDFGIVDDAHAGTKNRQVSLLSFEAIDEFRKKGNINVKEGDFAENLTLEGIDFSQLKIGTRIKISSDIILEVSQIGKECLTPCYIYKSVGDCIMPKQGIFAKVIKGGEIKLNDSVEVLG